MKTALVTGSAKNLGRYLALSLAKQNINVAIHHHHSKKEAIKTLKEISKYSAAMLVQADLKVQNEVSSAVLEIEKKFKTVDILINLVGNFIYEPITKTSFEKFKDVIESNLYSTFLTSQSVLPLMIKNEWGRIINFGCVAADTITVRKNTTPYYLAKTGVIMLTRVLAYEYAKYGITVNSISPGILKTSIIKQKMPAGKFTQFADIANAVNFLIKDGSQYVNGANLEVAGGWRPGY